MIALTAKQTRRRANERSAKRQRNKQSKIAGRKPERDPEYLEWIRTLPCHLCRLTTFPAQGSPTEAAHVGTRGLRQKCTDRATIPLCAHHHRNGPFSHHRAGKNFWIIWKLDREVLIAAYNLAYQEAE